MILQCAVDALQNWSEKWMLNVNVEHGVIVSYARLLINHNEVSTHTAGRVMFHYSLTIHRAQK